MTNEELDRLEALAKEATAGVDRWLGEEEATVIQSVPALVKTVHKRDAEIARLRALVEAAYREGLSFGWDDGELDDEKATRIWNDSAARRALDP